MLLTPIEFAAGVALCFMPLIITGIFGAFFHVYERRHHERD